jgi:4-amino-4-deoxy-L-arabinose transferase-like glycosyltransferase
MGEMPRKLPRVLWLALPLAYLLYFYHLDAAGLVGPDEPRYASIAREMARSGDWITPRLWGEPWFEKPPLLYWMSAAAFRMGFGPELAPRLPIAALAVAFLAFFWWIVRREFGRRAAFMATLILGTAGEWLGYSQVGVTDLPLTAAFSAAMLLAVPWIARRDGRYLPAAGAMLGLAVLAKGLVPLALAAPPLVLGWLYARKRPAGGPADPEGASRGVRLTSAALRVAIPFLLVSLPWYVFCYLRNGFPFLNDFFVRHHLSRFTSNALQHGQPWWFYLPVFAAAFVPWTPLLLLGAGRSGWRDPRRFFLLAWVLCGLLLFSLSVNKLPGYILPLLPAAALLAALALDEAAGARAWLAACALLLAAFPIAAPMLPAAVASGLSRAPRPSLEWTWLLPVVVAAAAWQLESRGKRYAAVFCIAAGTAAGMAYVKHVALPQLDRVASARSLWRGISDRSGDTCVDGIHRTWRYGLNYYSVTPLPECSAEARPLSLRQAPGQPPEISIYEPSPGGASGDVRLPATVDQLLHGVVPSRFRY